MKMKKLLDRFNVGASYVAAVIGMVVGWVAMALVFPVSKSWTYGRLSAEQAMNQVQQQQQVTQLLSAMHLSDAVNGDKDTSTGAYL
jgi:hypothetical protein